MKSVTVTIRMTDDEFRAVSRSLHRLTLANPEVTFTNEEWIQTLAREGIQAEAKAQLHREAKEACRIVMTPAGAPIGGECGEVQSKPEQTGTKIPGPPNPPKPKHPREFA